ncbi:MAG: hypothetical protein JWP04_3780, partial [Belnapia sp.]|nr:hypothetical protein [Belnapia sp.]
MIVTAPRRPAFPGRMDASSPPPPPAPALLPVVVQALPGAAGRLALRLRPEGRLAAFPARLRLIRALLQDAAATGGGAVFETTAGELLLLGVMAGAGRRAAALLAGLAPDAPPPELFLLPQDAGPLLTWAATALIAAPEVLPPRPSEGLAGLDARLEALPVDRVLRHRIVLRPGAAVPERGRRLRLSRVALATALGPLAADADLLAYAADRLTLRLLPALTAWARDVPGWRLLPLPRRGLPSPNAVPGLFGVLP